VSRTRRLVGGTTISFLHQAAVLVVGLWLTPFLLSHLGAQQLGLWIVADSCSRTSR